jgi:Fe-S-cluster-containing hydrogenase component 2
MAKRKIVCIDEEKCNGCGQCVNACAEGAIELTGEKARLVADKYCDGLAACLGTCPQDAITIIEREADSFDPEAVEKYLSQKRPDGEKECAGDTSHVSEAVAMPRGCPSANIPMFTKPPSSADESAGTPLFPHKTELTHWPVQIKLVPPTAPFLKNADILVASDCVPAAYPAFHEDLLKGKVLLIGCPKFDDTEEYVSKFTQIFAVANIKSITVAIMEVPCCSKMPAIIRAALQNSGKQIPLKTVVITRTGLKQ